MDFVFKFLAPYYALALSGAYSLVQNLQGLGVMTVWNGPYIDIQQSINALSGLYLIFLLFVLIISAIASLALSKKLALSLSILWLCPGAISLMGYQVFSPVIPEKYRIGTGDLGEPAGALVGAVALFVLSWALSTFFLQGFSR